MHYIPVNCQIFNFYLACFSASPFEFFYRFLSSLLLPYPFYLSPSFSISKRRVCCVCGVYVAFSPFVWGSAPGRHLRNGTRNPSIGRPHPPFLLLPFVANFLCCQPSFIFHWILQFPKVQSIIPFSRLPTIHLSSLDLLCPSVTFSGVFSTFNFPKSKFSGEPTQIRRFHTPPTWALLQKRSITHILENTGYLIKNSSWEISGLTINSGF